MSTIKKLFVALTLVLLVAGYSQAQYKPVNTNFDGVLPEVKQGSRSWLFSYTPFQSNLSGVPSGAFSSGDQDELFVNTLAGIGFNYYVTHNIELGLGLNFGSTSVKNIIAADTADFSSTTVGFSLDANYHMRSLYSVSPYIGINLNYGMASAERTPTTGSSTETKGNSFGAGLNLGFDWYFTEGLSLGGRYTIGFRSISAPEFTTGTTTTSGPDGSIFGTGTGGFMLKVHF